MDREQTIKLITEEFKKLKLSDADLNQLKELVDEGYFRIFDSSLKYEHALAAYYLYSKQSYTDYKNLERVIKIWLEEMYIEPSFLNKIKDAETLEKQLAILYLEADLYLDQVFGMYSMLCDIYKYAIDYVDKVYCNKDLSRLDNLCNDLKPYELYHQQFDADRPEIIKKLYRNITKIESILPFTWDDGI